LECARHEVCHTCGGVIHLGPVETSPGFGTYDEDEMVRLMLGDPPRCAECRGEARRAEAEP
jgi:hypothetical protein